MLAGETKERYLADFRRMAAHRGAAGPAWLEKLRAEGMASFQALGFPTPRHEEWRYTSVEPIASQSYILASEDRPLYGAESWLARPYLSRAGHRLVFVNGVIARELSRGQSLPAGARLEDLADAIATGDAAVAEQLGRYAPNQSQPFTALNTAFVSGGALVVIPSGCRLDQPIQLVFLSTGGELPVISHPRVLIILGAGSAARIVENYIGRDHDRYFCNAVTELVCEEGAVVEHCRVQEESDMGYHVGMLAAHLARGCRLSAHAVTLRGALLRNNVRVVLDGEDADCLLNGLYLADGAQHVDHFTEIEHARPRGTSTELYKGILAGSAHGVFHGKVVVHKDAQKTNARQINRNLLLSSGAAVNTKPQLEIHADDVKCSHGSTIGQIDADALFYLRSRGLGPDQARSLLSFAFASEVVGKISIGGVRRWLEDYLSARFHSDER